MANGGGAVVGNIGKRLPSKLQWSRKTIFLASSLNLAGTCLLQIQESHTSVARLATRAALHEFWIF